MPTRSAPITKHITIDGTPKHLGEEITEEGRFRIIIPRFAPSSVWLGNKNVTPDSNPATGGDPYTRGTATQLPTTSLEGWYAVTNGSPVTIIVNCATGGPDAPDWSDAGTVGGGNPTGASDQTSPFYGTTLFGQQRVAGRELLFENVQGYVLDTRQWGIDVANGGTVVYNSTTGATDLSVSGTSGSRAVMQTHTYFPYSPGSSPRAVFTLVDADLGQINQRRRWGLFDGLDGLFFELVGTALRIVRRSSVSGSPVDTVLAERADWLDPYGEMLIDKGQRYEIDLQWLSFGVVRFWANGRLLYQTDFANVLTLPYMRTAQLPLRFEIENTDASVASSMSYVCSVVYLDGGEPLRYVPGKWALSAPKTAIDTTPTPVLGLRVSQLFAGRANRKIVVPAFARISNATQRATVRLYFNPTTITGGTWNPIPDTPWVEYNEGITSITDGTLISEVFLPTASDTQTLDGRFAFALNGAHLRRTFDNADGDAVVFVAASYVGLTDIVGLFSTFITYG